MKFTFGGVFHESNTFCPCKTTLKHFQYGYLGRSKDVISTLKGKKSFFGGVIDAASELTIQLYPTISAAARALRKLA
jgi:microcystin degradation protein MlrC